MIENNMHAPILDKNLFLLKNFKKNLVIIFEVASLLLLEILAKNKQI
jgi:hypothetical protein